MTRGDVYYENLQAANTQTRKIFIRLCKNLRKN